MQIRTFLASIHIANFLIGILASGYFLTNSWVPLENWQIFLYAYYLLLGLCGVAIACWIIWDGRHIQSVTVDVGNLETRIRELERQIDRIKTVKLSKLR